MSSAIGHAHGLSCSGKRGTSEIFPCPEPSPATFLRREAFLRFQNSDQAVPRDSCGESVVSFSDKTACHSMPTEENT